MRVALKFCGGCDPAYDRVEYWEQIRLAAGDRIDWVRLDSGSYDAVLLICGCEKTCPRDDLSGEDCLVTLTNNSLDADLVVLLLESCLRAKIAETA
jgi:hypothetical protein